MKPVLEKSKEKKSPKHQQSTVSTDDNRVNDSLIRLINSQHLTMQMAVGYLFKWRNNSKILILLLERIQNFGIENIVSYIPTIIFIMSLHAHQEFYNFCEGMAKKSLPFYLLVRWSFSTYWSHHKKGIDVIRDKLDSSLLKKQKHIQFEEFNEEHLQKSLKQKEAYSNYLFVLNEFYQRLFKIPEKLKKHEKVKRNQKLRNYLNKITSTFMKEQNGFLNGISFPTHELSCIVVRILPEYCFTFSTKERVPFKLVFETISYEDAIKCKNGILPSNEGQKQFDHKKSLILPKSYFGEEWMEAQKKIRNSSPYSSIPSYQIKSFMVKSGDDLRQQYMAMQLIKLVQDLSIKQNLKLWVRSYAVIPFNSDSGLIQFVPDTKTVSYLKQKSQQKSLRKIYQQIYGQNWQEATTNFIQSLAGYSLIQYLFQIKDRHNNNILVDTNGHIIHIDFSFMISSSPGNMGFERAPFKLTEDYIELMEGTESDIFNHFRMLFFLGLKFLRKYKKEIMQNVLMMTHCSGLKCYDNFDQEKMQKRFYEYATDEELEGIVDQIVKDAYSSYTTSNYDRFQWYTNKIFS